MGCLRFREGSGENNFESGECSMEQIVKGYRDDAALHVWGDMDILEEKKLMFPLLAHA